MSATACPSSAFRGAFEKQVVFSLLIPFAWIAGLLAPALRAASESPPTIQWQRSFGGTGDEWLYALQKTPDDGYIIGGTSDSGVSGNKTSVNYGGNDYWVIKLDADGNKEWEDAFGGSGSDVLNAILPTSDGGYLLGGNSASGVSGNKTSTNWGSSDYWVVKLDASGHKVWEASFGSSRADELHSLCETPDGYLLGGWADSAISGNKTEAGFGNDDFWLVKLDREGNKTWERMFGGSSADWLYTIQPTTDGGYLLGGWSDSPAAGIKGSENFGAWDYWVVKLDANFNLVWDRSFGGNDADYLWSVRPLSTGGYVLGGSSQSYPSGNKTSPNYASQWGTGPDYWVVKLDANGDKVWENSFGGDNGDSLFTLQVTGSGYLLGGSSASGVSGNKTTPNLGAYDCWMLKQKPPAINSTASIGCRC
jgi:hypothetical protein